MRKIKGLAEFYKVDWQSAIGTCKKLIKKYPVWFHVGRYMEFNKDTGKYDILSRMQRITLYWRDDTYGEEPICEFVFPLPWEIKEYQKWYSWQEYCQEYDNDIA